MHGGIRGNFCVSAICERKSYKEIIQTEQMHLQIENYMILPESNLDEMFDNVINNIWRRQKIYLIYYKVLNGF